jgi:membrane protein
VLWQALNVLVSLGVITLLFAMIYKVLPDVKLEWRDVWVGGLVTAGLFTIGKLLIGLYLGTRGVSSSYGAAGSVIVILVWVYYSSQIILLGAEFTREYAAEFGRRVRPEEFAEDDGGKGKD